MTSDQPSTVNLLSVEEVARSLEVRPATVAEWCRQGRLPGLKVGRSWRIRHAALEEFLERAEQRPTLVAQLRAFLAVPDHLLGVSETVDLMHQLDAAFFQVGEAYGALLVKYFGGERTPVDQLRMDFERHGLEVRRLEAAGRFRFVPETDPVSGRVAALDEALAAESAAGRPIWASFNWTERVDLETTLEQQAALAVVVGAERLVVKTDLLAPVVDEWPSPVQRRAWQLHGGIIELSEGGLVLSRRTPAPDR